MSSLNTICVFQHVMCLSSFGRAFVFQPGVFLQFWQGEYLSLVYLSSLNIVSVLDRTFVFDPGVCACLNRSCVFHPGVFVQFGQGRRIPSWFVCPFCTGHVFYSLVGLSSLLRTCV